MAAKLGTHIWPTAAYAPWQKGRVERRIGAIKETMRALIMHRGLSEYRSLKAVCAQLLSASVAAGLL